MNILNFLLANWDGVLGVATVIAAVVSLTVKKRCEVLDRILFALVTWAEREYGGGAGNLKLAVVIEKFYPHIPVIVRLFVSTNMLEALIEKALAEAKKRWAQNPTLLSK